MYLPLLSSFAVNAAAAATVPGTRRWLQPAEMMILFFTAFIFHQITFYLVSLNASWIVQNVDQPGFWTLELYRLFSIPAVYVWIFAGYHAKGTPIFKLLLTLAAFALLTALEGLFEHWGLLAFAHWNLTASFLRYAFIWLIVSVLYAVFRRLRRKEEFAS